MENIDICLITAFNVEYNAVKVKLFENRKYKATVKPENSIYKFIAGDYNGIRLALIETGVGCSNAQRAMAYLLNNYQTRLILNLGIAGGINAALSIGELLFCRSVALEDEPANVINLDAQSSAAILKKLALTISSGKIMTVKNVIGDDVKRNKFRETYNIDAVDMELFALAREWQSSGRPTVIMAVKSVSDIADDSLSDIAPLFSSNGKLSVNRLIKQIISHPLRLIKAVINLQQSSRIAINSIQNFISTYLIEYSTNKSEFLHEI